MNFTDEEFAQVGLNLGDVNVNRLMYEVLARPDAAAALEYLLDYPVDGPFCTRCRTRHWVCPVELSAMGAEHCGGPDCPVCGSAEPDCEPGCEAASGGIYLTER